MGERLSRSQLRQRKTNTIAREVKRGPSVKPRSCFWIWPWGHVKESDPDSSIGWRCRVCGRTGIDDGPA